VSCVDCENDHTKCAFLQPLSLTDLNSKSERFKVHKSDPSNPENLFNSIHCKLCGGRRVLCVELRTSVAASVAETRDYKKTGILRTFRDVY
jgi:hypothetical protein